MATGAVQASSVGFWGRFGALSQPRYRRYWLGSLASVGAIQVVLIGQGWLIVDKLHGPPLALGYVGAATAVPTILINIFGGVLADRLDRRWLLMVTSLISAALLMLLAALDLTGVVQIWHVVAIAALQGTVLGFDAPTRNAFFPALIDREHMMSAVALNSVMWQFSRIVTPSIGGVLIHLLGTEAVFLLGAAGFGAMFAVLVTLKVVHVPPQVHRNVLANLLEGITYISRNRLFLVLVPLTYANMFFGMQYIQLMPLFAQDFAVGSAGLGVILSFLGLGAITGTVIIGKLQAVRRLGRLRDYLKNR
ncbi:MAG: MFS transporter [Dehalococcoidia bacterium]